MMIGTRLSALICRQTSYPSSSGSMMSRTTRSKRWLRNWMRPSLPSPAVVRRNTRGERPRHAAPGCRHPQPPLGKPEARHLADRRVVLDEENAFVHAFILTDGRVGFRIERLCRLYFAGGSLVNAL